MLNKLFLIYFHVKLLDWRQFGGVQLVGLPKKCGFTGGRCATPWPPLTLPRILAANDLIYI